LIGDRRRRCVVWGIGGKGAAAANRLFAELDPLEEPRATDDAVESLEINSRVAALANQGADEEHREHWNRAAPE
jgi:hypothetical protein